MRRKHLSDLTAVGEIFALPYTRVCLVIPTLRSAVMNDLYGRMKLAFTSFRPFPNENEIRAVNCATRYDRSLPKGAWHSPLGDVAGADRCDGVGARISR